MDGLTEYRVELYEEKGVDFKLLFDCWAEDEYHAKEQALDAYPDGEVTCISLISG